MGLGMRGLAWQPQVRGIRRYHPVATFDNRGVGLSDPSSGPYHMDDLSRDALVVLDAAAKRAGRWHQAHVVGVSMGGMIAQHVALRAPERVLSLSLIATHCGGRGAARPPRGGLRLFLRAMTARGGSARIAALRSLLYPPEFLETNDLTAIDERLRRELGTRTSIRTLLAQLAAVARHDTAARLEVLASTPTLILRPDRDRLVRPSHADRLHALIPNSRLIAFPDAGHGLTSQSPDDVNAVLMEHFAAAENLYTRRVT